jgi:GNAT superfamily N-acetyltransferase
LGSYPAVKIGRLGVATSHRGEGIGTDIVSAVKQMLINRQSVSATRFLTVDAYLSAVPFYEKNGFRLLLNTPCEDTLPMYFDLMQLVK